MKKNLKFTIPLDLFRCFSAFLLKQLIFFLWSIPIALSATYYNMSMIMPGTPIALNDLGDVLFERIVVKRDGSFSHYNWGPPYQIYLKDINNTGQIAGTVYFAAQQSVFLSDYTAPSIDPMELTGYGLSHAALAINDKQDIVGYSGNGTDYCAWLYSQGHIIALSLNSSKPFDINSIGNAVGYSMTGNHQAKYAVIWRDGEMINLGSFGTVWSEAHALNDNNQVVGISRDSSGSNKAFFWENGSFESIGVLSGHKSSNATGINNIGQVVGTSESSIQSSGFLWESGILYDLNELTINLGFEKIVKAIDINENGTILGYTESGYGVLLTPVPIPNALSIFGGGLIGLYAFRKNTSLKIKLWWSSNSKCSIW